jgi:hypothetical protein
MRPNEQGRHCSSCNKTVVDFSGMTDSDLIHYLARPRSADTCGRFRVDQIQHQPRFHFGMSYWRHTFCYMAIWLLAAFVSKPGIAKELIPFKLKSDAKNIPISENRYRNDSVIYLFKGKITDSKTGLPLRFATLTLHKESTDKVVVGYTDNEGNYRLEVPATRAEEPMKLVVTRRRYKDLIVRDLRPSAEEQNFDMKPHSGKYYWQNGHIHKRRNHHVMGKF